MLLQQRSSKGRLTVKLIRDCCWMERSNLPPMHATGSGQTEHRKTGPLLRMQHSTLVGCSSARRRRRRQLFRCCFYNNQTKPKKQQILNNNTATALFVFIGSLAWAPPPGCAVPVMMINWSIKWEKEKIQLIDFNVEIKFHFEWKYWITHRMQIEFNWIKFKKLIKFRKFNLI